MNMSVLKNLTDLNRRGNTHPHSATRAPSGRKRKPDEKWYIGILSDLGIEVLHRGLGIVSDEIRRRREVREGLGSELRELQRLRDRDEISDEEFQALRAAILRRHTQPDKKPGKA